MKLYPLFLFLILILNIVGSNVSAQELNENYQFVIDLDSQMKRKLIANEVMFDQQEKYVIVNYGNKPTFIVVYEFGLWLPLATFRLTNWVEFSGAYVDYENNQLYIKESRFSSEYYRLDIEKGSTDIVECELAPGGCPVVEPKQSAKDMYTADKSYYVTINKRNAREVKVYTKKQ
jgi:hypothetical protein